MGGWHLRRLGQLARGGRYGNHEIGIALFPEYRGKGIGTEAQRQLVHHLFEVTPANRIQAGTEADNLAEQRALEKVGFIREGVQRGFYFRHGSWQDSECTASPVGSGADSGP